MSAFEQVWSLDSSLDSPAPATVSSELEPITHLNCAELWDIENNGSTEREERDNNISLSSPHTDTKQQPSSYTLIILLASPLLLLAGWWLSDTMTIWFHVLYHLSPWWHETYFRPIAGKVSWLIRACSLDQSNQFTKKLYSLKIRSSSISLRQVKWWGS